MEPDFTQRFQSRMLLNCNGRALCQAAPFEHGELQISKGLTQKMQL
jgi:hypothetical protein